MKALATDTVERSVLASQGSVAGAEEGIVSLDRRAVRRRRLRERRSQRLYALGGLVVLAAFLAATVVVVDMVR